MTDRLTEDGLKHIEAEFNVNEYDDLHALVAEVREHRARWNDVRVVHSGDTVPLTTYHEALNRIREALAEETR